MKRLRIPGQLLGARPRAPARIRTHPTLRAPPSSISAIRDLSVSPRAQCSPMTLYHASTARSYSTAGDASSIVFEDPGSAPPEEEQEGRGRKWLGRLPSPLPERALTSPKLAALHARLALPPELPLQTLARTLVDSSADYHLRFNNVHLAFLGRSLINYHTSEWLICRYPRLPMAILYSAMKGYAGPKSLQLVARQWGVEAAAEPGEEVDPGLLQFSRTKEGTTLDAMGYKRTENDYLTKFKWRRGMSSRVVFDDEFGDTVSPYEHERRLEREAQEWRAERGLLSKEEMLELEDTLAESEEMEIVNERTERAFAQFTRAIVGAIFIHVGREAAKEFILAHILSRRLDLSALFEFTRPTRELARLCAREGFEKPVARLLSETGRLSRTPVYVVGIYSGVDKLGEGSGASLDAARLKAAMHALKSWYLYSPGEDVRLPSETYNPQSKPWTPPYIDLGEIVV